MASPDTRAYVDLTVFDDNPIEVLNEILSAGRALLPEWTPAVGQIETVLAEAIAYRSSELAAAINRIPDATTEVLLQLFGLTRDNGTAATATISIEFNAAGSLPQGTEILYVDAVTEQAYNFSLDADVSRTGGGTTTGVAVTAVSVGTQYNIGVSGSNAVVIAPSTVVESIVFTSDSAGGKNEETDAEFFNRATTLLASYTTATTTSTQIKYYVSANKTYANRVEVYDRRRYRNRDTQGTDYSLHDGAILVAVASTVSTPASAVAELPVSAANLSDLYTSLEARTPSGLTIDVMSAELVDIDVTVDVKAVSGANTSTLRTALENAVKAYFDPNVWPFNTQRVRYNDVVTLLENVTGVDYIQDLKLNASTLLPSGGSNVGYTTASGGSKATVTLDIAGGATDGSYGIGEAAFYYVDSTTDPDSPTVYTFVNTEAFTIASNTASDVAYQAISNGVNFNDTSNGGKIPLTAGALIGSSGDSGGTATIDGNATGGSNDTSQFTALNGTGDGVAVDVVLRNLGTLVTVGDINITFL
jgi:hypothetical protein